MKFASNSGLMVPSGALQKQTQVFFEEHTLNTDLNKFSDKIVKNVGWQFKITKHTRKQATVSKSYQKQQIGNQITKTKNYSNPQIPRIKVVCLMNLKD